MNAELLQILSDRFKDRFSAGQSVWDLHGRDSSPYDTTPPDCVVFPTTTEEVVEVVRTCARHRVPIIAYGAGTSLEGHIMAVEGGVTIDLSKMNKVLAVNGEHGIGMHKIPLLTEEFGEPAVNLMRKLKMAWDPLNILNPGKVVLSS